MQKSKFKIQNDNAKSKMGNTKHKTKCKNQNDNGKWVKGERQKAKGEWRSVFKTLHMKHNTN